MADASPATLNDADAELKRWRARLAAASRNVSELSELPEFAAARRMSGGAGRLADRARALVATMDELWQGVLLIGAALDRAEEARKAGSRWRPDEAARQVFEILRGPSISVDLAETPVLHRTLLGAPRGTATVTPDVLLQTMDAAFDKARAQLTGIAEAEARAAALRTRLAGAIAQLPSAKDFSARLEAAFLPDPLDRLDALEALASPVEAAAAAFASARAGLAAAREKMAELQAEAARAASAAKDCRRAVALTPPAPDDAEIRDLAAWLDGIGRVIEAGRTEAGLVGLANWRARRDQLASGLRALTEAATAALAERDELRARLGALRAKHRARGAPSGELDGLAAAAKDALAREPADLVAARQNLAAYQAALAER